MNFGKVIASLKKLLTQGWILVQTPKLGVYKRIARWRFGNFKKHFFVHYMNIMFMSYILYYIL